MNEVLINLLQFVLVYFMIKWLYLIVEHQIISKKARNQELLDKVLDHVHKVKVEKHGDQFYWFDIDNDMFLAQGKDMKEIIGKVRTTYKDHVFITETGELICAPDWFPK